MPGMEAGDLRAMTDELSKLTAGIRDLVQNFSGMGSAAKSMSTEFSKSSKAVDGINAKLVKEQKKVKDIALAESARNLANKKQRSDFIKALNKKDGDAVRRLLAQEKNAGKKVFMQQLKNDKLTAERNVKQFKKEKMLDARKAAAERKLDEKTAKNKVEVETRNSRHVNSWEQKKQRNKEWRQQDKQESVERNTHPGKIAGDMKGALGTVGKMFSEKSLNPLDWVKTGFETKEGLQDSFQSMQDWSEILKGEQAKRKSATKGAKTHAGVEGVPEGKKGGISNLLGDITSKTNVGAGKAAGGIPGVDSAKMSVFGKAAGGLGMLIKVVDGLSAALGFLMKASWIFTLISGISALVSAGIELDKFFKKLNKTFLDMAGSALGSGDMVSGMKTFNDAIFSLNRNLKLGLKAEDIQGMFKAMSGSGIVPSNLDKEAGGYGKVIEMVRKTNLDLGISFEEAGKTITDQMMDLKSSFDDSRKSLQVMGFAATKAGVQSNKFYAAINNSVSALSFLGNFTKQASASLSAFMTQSGLSFKDASKAADEYMQVFEKMDWKQMQVAFAMAGPDLVNAMQDAAKVMIDEPLQKLNKELQDLSMKRDATTDSGARDKLTESIMDLSKQQNSLAIRSKGFADAIEDFKTTGTTGALQQYRDLLTGSLGTVIGAITENTGIGDKNYTAALVALQKGLGISADLMRAVTMEFKNLDVSFKKVNTTFSSALGNDDVVKTLQANNGEQINKLEALIINGKNNKDNQAVLTEMSKGISKIGSEGFNLSGDALTSFTTGLTSLVSEGDASDEVVKALAEIKKGNIKEAMKYLGPDKKLFGKIFDASHKSAKLSEDGYDELSKQNVDLINGTTSAADYMDIAKDTLKYIAAKNTSGMVAGIAKGVISIAGDVSLLATDQRNKRDEKLKDLATSRVFSPTGRTFDEAVSQFADGSDKIKILQEKLDKGGLSAKDEKNTRKELKTLTDRNSEFTSQIENTIKKAPEDFGDRLKQRKKEIEDARLAGKEVDAVKAKALSMPAGKTAADALTPSVEGAVDAILGKKAADVSTGAGPGLPGVTPGLLDKMSPMFAPVIKGGEGGQAAQITANLKVDLNGASIDDPLAVQQFGNKLREFTLQTLYKFDKDKQLKK